MMGFSSPQPKCQVVDCEAAYDNGDADDLHDVVNHVKTVKERVEELSALLPSVILAR